ncbi:MAG: hypothetical protein JWM30_1882 [Burkholderia sp.]|nr:hypothetical protein [Burkholderia sp.]
MACSSKSGTSTYTLITGEKRDVTPYFEPVLKVKAATPRPRANAKTPTLVKKNLFERLVEQVRTWVQSRAGTVKLNRALLPFIKNANDEASVSLTGAYFKNLASALAYANGANDGPEELINKVVRNSVKGLTLAQQSVLREKFSGKPTDDHFLLALNGCVQDALVAEGENYLAEGLQIFAQHSVSPFNVEQAAAAMAHSLETILHLVHPGSDAIAPSATALPLRDQFRSASMFVTKENVQGWFKRQPPAEQRRIRMNLRTTAADLVMAASTHRADQLLQAFSELIMDSLPPAPKH